MDVMRSEELFSAALLGVATVVVIVFYSAALLLH
jgi:hypothetical protein